MRTIDLNADVGEADNPDWAWSEAQILHAVSSANIACGGHAGDDETMRTTVLGALAGGVTIGAHPAYPDRANFGRRSLVLGEDISEAALELNLIQQIVRLSEICAEEGAAIAYVKPHGQLYNDAVSDARKANLIARTIAAIDPGLILLGGPNSEMGRAASEHGLAFVAEGFIDRRYSDHGHLVSRSSPGAIIEGQGARLQQAVNLATTGAVETVSGKTLRITARSLCLHGDSAGAVETAHQARMAIEQAGVTIRAFA